jgi:hypothetical protein
MSTPARAPAPAPLPPPTLPSVASPSLMFFPRRRRRGCFFVWSRTSCAIFTASGSGAGYSRSSSFGCNSLAEQIKINDLQLTQWVRRRVRAQAVQVRLQLTLLLEVGLHNSDAFADAVRRRLAVCRSGSVVATAEKPWPWPWPLPPHGPSTLLGTSRPCRPRCPPCQRRGPPSTSTHRVQEMTKKKTLLSTNGRHSQCGARWNSRQQRARRDTKKGGGQSTGSSWA